MSKQEKNSRQKVLAGKFCIGYQSKLSNYKDIFLISCFEKGLTGKKMPMGTRLGSAGLGHFNQIILLITLSVIT
jgi:hypothetical protein